MLCNGRGKTQNQAVRELLELPQGNAFRENVLELLISWRVSMEINNILETEDREVFMTLSQTYQLYQAGTDRLYPTEYHPIVRALRGEKNDARILAMV